MQARVREMQTLAEEKAEGGDAASNFVELSVGGRTFITTVANITRFPRSVLATLWLDEHSRSTAAASTGTATATKKVMRVDGDPTHFQLMLNYLRDPKRGLPVDAAQSAHVLQWLERRRLFTDSTIWSNCARRHPAPRSTCET